MAADFYATLGVPYNTTSEEIRNAYFLLARQYHPDSNPNIKPEEKELFLAIQQAYEVLSNPQKRRNTTARLRPKEEPALKFRSTLNTAGL